MAGKTTIPEVRLFPAFKSLFEEKYRYAIYYGGRGSGKSWNIVRYILVRMLKAKIRGHRPAAKSCSHSRSPSII